MTVDHPVRRFLARVCSDETMATVVDPTLADMRVERKAWRGYLALARALALHSVLSAPGVVHRAWRDDEFAMPRMAMWVMAAAVLFALAIATPAFNTPEVWPALLLVPQGVVWTLPAMLLLAVPAALRGQALNDHLTRRTIAVAIGFVAVTFALMIWIAPEANAQYREAAGFTMTGGTTSVVREFPHWSAADPSRLLDYQYHQQLAFGVAALPFALLGLGLSTIYVVRRRPRLIGLVAAGAYMFVGFPLELWTSALLLRASSVPPFALAWAPKLLVFAAGLLLVTRRSPRFPNLPASRPPASPAA